MYHGTIYGGANGVGKTVDEARLEAVLATARAICDDSTAFDHDADEIFKAEQYRWWQDKLQEQQEELEEKDNPGPGQRKKAQRRIRLIEQLMGEWQEEHDYWPEEKAEASDRIEARAAKIRADTARRRAASAALAAVAAGQAGRTGAS